MYHSTPGLLVGFHGCEQSVRNRIVSGSTMIKASENGYDWLGVGFYFWENNFASSAGIYGQEMPKNKTVKGSKDKLLRELDCAVIENLHAMQRQIQLKPFASVRGVFVEGEELYPGAGFHDKNHIQICIRNPNCIKGFFIPRQEVVWRG